MTAAQLAQRFHELYEELAPAHGYETRKESAVPWDQVPQKNRTLMIAVCERILAEIAFVQYTQSGRPKPPKDHDPGGPASR
jgi:hypothetical protein